MFLLLALLLPTPALCLLYPQDTESRLAVSLDGIWRFRTSPKGKPDEGFRKHWFAKGLMASDDAQREVIEMPVPASYNDITQDR